MKANPFVVVGGMPRSGTRQFTDHLNASKKFSIQGELHPALFSVIKSLLVTSESIYSRHPDQIENIKKKKRRLVFELFKGLSKYYPVEDVGGYVGFKTPNSEFYINDILDILKGCYGGVQFYYCIRDVLPCLASLRCAPWYGSSANYFVSTYIRSMNSAIEAAQKDRVKVTVLHLDDYIGSYGKEEWVEEKLFKVLGVDLSQEDIDKVVAAKNVNSTKNRFGIERKGDEITDDDLMILRERESELNDCIEMFNTYFSSSVKLLNLAQY